ncbi:MMPL family transporter [Streptomyces sp. NPDC102487]|uniref:MMPL family transporter n=1 Tax=Streptomyces sp. NPDC102487 TaxID=3366182 RepID=UPI003817B5EB
MVAAGQLPFASKTVSADVTTAYAQVSYTAKDADLTDSDHSNLDKALESGREQGLTVEASGNALAPPAESHTAEAIGFALAAVILLITFGSLVAAGLPLLTALAGVGVSMAAITALSGPFNLNSNASALATMLGIAVGIDYALFIISRYRSERADGHDAREAAARANGTAGITVVIALAGLAVVNLGLRHAVAVFRARLQRPTHRDRRRPGPRPRPHRRPGHRQDDHQPAGRGSCDPGSLQRGRRHRHPQELTRQRGHLGAVSRIMRGAR